MSLNRLGLMVAGMALVAGHAAAQAQEELLWKVDSTVSATLIPDYKGGPTPFTIKSNYVAPSTASDAEKAAAEAAARAAVEAAAAAAARAAAEKAALKKVTAIISSPDAITADLSQVKIEGILQGPLGNSILWQGQWLKTGSKFKVPTTLGAKMTETYNKLAATDALAAGLLRDKLYERQSRQPTIDVTLSQITSQTAIFTDGRQRYTLQLSQPPL
ncbi:MAG TPA: hypothetical protein VHP58_02960 [Alphaproteobacteria bacterium]|nr:hypothetical protein [Alphaproteobacteria bacterium]